jgi:transcriptional regulator with XRE-family HTH domain
VITGNSIKSDELLQISIWYFESKNGTLGIHQRICRFFMPELGKKLKDLRINSKLSQAEFAEKLGKATYQELERGTRDKTVSFDELSDIAQKLNISIWELIPELPAVNNNHNQWTGGGIIFGTLIYNASPDDSQHALLTENAVLKEKIAGLEEQLRLMQKLLEQK